MTDVALEAWPDPPPTGEEATAIVASLERMRATFAWKADGLDAEGLRATTAASSITIGGLLKHLALIEDDMFTKNVAGRDMPEPWASADWAADPDWEWHSAGDDPPEELYAVWNDAVARSREALAEALANGGLDQPVTALTDPHGTHPDLRRKLLDMLEEYGRHVGHADIIRESIDGLVGEDRPS